MVVEYHYLYGFFLLFFLFLFHRHWNLLNFHRDEVHGLFMYPPHHSMLIVLPRFCFTETLKYVSCRKCFSHKNWKNSCVQWEESQGDKWANRKQTPSSSSTSLMRPVFSFSMDGKVYVCLHLCVCVCVCVYSTFWVHECVFRDWGSEKLS